MKLALRPVLVCVLALTTLVALHVDARASHLTIAWSSPAANSDGTPLGGLVGYRVYYGLGPSGAAAPPCNGAYVDVSNVGSYRLEGLSDGLYYIQVTARNSAGFESQCSNETTGYAVASPAPAAPAPQYYSPPASDSYFDTGK